MVGKLAIFVALASSGILNFLALAVYSRLLTPSEYGFYAVLLSISMVVMAFGFSWLEMSFVRFLSAETRTSAKKPFSTLLALYFAVGFLVVPLFSGFYALELFGFSSELAWLLCACLVFSEVAFIIASNYLRVVDEHLVHYSAAIVFRSVVSFALGWLLLINGYGYLAIFFAMAVSFFVTAFFIVVGARLWQSLRLRSADLAVGKEICRFGLPLILVMALQTCISATDRFLLISFLGAEVTGQYSVVQDLVLKLLIFLIAIIHKVTYPSVVKSFESKGAESAIQHLNRNVVFILALLIPAALVMTVYPTSIVSVMLGDSFQTMAVELMPYHVGIAFINCLSMFYVVMPFYLYKKTRLMIVPCIVALVANILVGYFAIKDYGVYGALFGSFAAYSVHICLSLLLGLRFVRLQIPCLEVFKIIACSAVMIFIISGLAGDELSALVALTLVGGASYALLVLIADVGKVRSLLMSALAKRKR